MTTETRINIPAHNSPYTLELDVWNVEALKAFSAKNKLEHKNSDEVISILLASNETFFSKTVIYKNGEISSGPKGEPAVQYFTKEGKVYYKQRRVNGEKDDYPNGDPAVITFHQGTETLESFAHFKQGHAQDGINGAPAYRRFDQEGNVLETRRMTGDVPNDGPNGEPAVQQFKAGKLIYIEHRDMDIEVNGPNGAPMRMRFIEEYQEYIAVRLPNKERQEKGLVCIFTADGALKRTSRYAVVNGQQDTSPVAQEEIDTLIKQEFNRDKILELEKKAAAENPKKTPAVSNWTFR